MNGESTDGIDTPFPSTGRRVSRLMVAVAAAFILIGGGTAAAFAVPVVALDPTRPLAQMLPAGTVFYLSADLNPTGAKKARLDAFERAFTDQPGWHRIAAMYGSVTQSPSNVGTCYQQTQGQVGSHLNDLGHTAALALVGGKNLSSSSIGGATDDALRGNAVILASLHVRRTLVQALQGFALTLQQKTTTYRGTTIRQESFPSCGQADSHVPQTVYAALVKGYVVLAVQTAPIKRIIDTASGSPDLATSAGYSRLAARLPHDPLATYYINSRRLAQAGVPSSATHFGFFGGGTGTSVGSLTLEAGGARLTSFSLAPKGAARAHAGLLASHLPSDAMGYLSLGGLSQALRPYLQAARGSDLLPGSLGQSLTAILGDVTSDLSGEADLVLLHPNGPLAVDPAADRYSLPLSLVWQVHDAASARHHLADLMRRTQEKGGFHGLTAADGTPYVTRPDGYGYGVRSGWATASLSTPQVMTTLGARPTLSLASTSAYREALLSGSLPRSVWYLNLHDLRLQLQKSFLPTLSPIDRQQYRSMALPVLAPLGTIAGSTGVSTDGRTSTSTLFIGIRPARS